MALVFFCYIRVSQKVWANAANHEKVMDPVKLKKSRSVHLKATIHSCVQIILIVATLSPHLYEETVRTFHTVDFENNEPNISDVYHPPLHSSLAGDKPDLPFSDDGSHNGSQEDTSVSASALSKSSSGPDRKDFARVIGLTLNYTLLALG